MYKSSKNGHKKIPSYGVIEIIGGIIIPREYRHIKKYKNEIFKLRNQWLTQREICEHLEFKAF